MQRLWCHRQALPEGMPPQCGSRNVDYLTRIIGYMKRVSNFSAARQAEAERRHYGKPDITEKTKEEPIIY